MNRWWLLNEWELEKIRGTDLLLGMGIDPKLVVERYTDSVSVVVMLVKEETWGKVPLGAWWGENKRQHLFQGQVVPVSDGNVAHSNGNVEGGRAIAYTNANCGKHCCNVLHYWRYLTLLINEEGMGARLPLSFYICYGSATVGGIGQGVPSLHQYQYYGLLLRLGPQSTQCLRYCCYRRKNRGIMPYPHLPTS